MSIIREPYGFVHADPGRRKETYGGPSGMVFVECMRIRPEAGTAKTCILFSHPIGGGAFLPLVTAVASLPFTFFISNDAFYFGVVPILAEAGRIYGHTAEAIGRALPRRRRLSRHRFRKDPMTVSEELFERSRRVIDRFLDDLDQAPTATR